MNRKKISLKAWGISFFLMGLLQFNPAENLASPQLIAQIKRIPRNYDILIQGDFSEDKLLTRLDPRELRVGRGDNVTWINESRMGVRMKFGKGTQCRQVSVKALGWNLEPEKCYETKDSLKSKETTTIRFKDIGLYRYEIEFIGKDRKEQGTIHVQTEDR